MKYLILGGGPAGLTVANQLLRQGETSFLLLEKEQEVGGLCRSSEVDGSPLDIGGGHFLDVSRPKVNRFLFSFLEEAEWDLYCRDSRIQVLGKEISHPIESNLWQLDIQTQVEYLKSIATAGCNLGNPMPEDFIEWIYWKFGARLAEDYMIPYNQKMFSENLRELGTYWLEKLPDVSFEETLLSCLEKKTKGKQPAHTQFYYPKRYGYGEVWRRMGEAVKSHISFGVNVETIDFTNRIVNDYYKAENIIITIPWTSLRRLDGMPEVLQKKISRLKYTSIQIAYKKEKLASDAQWVYIPDMQVPYHRILVRHNFCPNSKGYWTETNMERAGGKQGKDIFCNVYAYPLNTIEKPQIMKDLLFWCKKRRVYGLGRWGEWEHYNSDVTVEKALRLAEEFV